MPEEKLAYYVELQMNDRWWKYGGRTKQPMIFRSVETAKNLMFREASRPGYNGRETRVVDDQGNVYAHVKRIEKLIDLLDPPLWVRLLIALQTDGHKPVGAYPDRDLRNFQLQCRSWVVTFGETVLKEWEKFNAQNPSR